MQTLRPLKRVGDPTGEAREPSLAAPASVESKPRISHVSTGDTSLGSRRTGAELPAAMYRTIVAAYAWMRLVTWLDFSRTVEASWLASVAIVIGIVFFSIPFLLRRTNRALARAPQAGLEVFLHSDLETATGRLPGRDAYVQIITIPVCLALAATAFGTSWVLES
jgi:hypothetical protein